MSRHRTAPPRVPGRLYMTEGGIETEIMYKWAHALPEFAMFPLLDDPRATEDMKGIWRRMFAVAARNGFSVVLNGLDYRASPDWGAKLGYSPEGLAEMQHRCIDFLTGLRDEAPEGIAEIVVSATIGPRGDAYARNRTITAAEAEDYHSVQLSTVAGTAAQMAWAMTFNNIPEAVGTIRAASALGIPIAMGLSLDGRSRLNSGPALREAVESIDADTDGAAAFFALNCSHPVEYEPALDGGSWERRLRCIRPNASKMEKIALCKIGHLEEGDPEELGRQMGALARRQPQMDIWGGCCGTGEVHLDEIARNVRAVRRARAQEPA